MGDVVAHFLPENGQMLDVAKGVGPASQTCTHCFLEVFYDISHGASKAIINKIFGAVGGNYSASEADVIECYCP